MAQYNNFEGDIVGISDPQLEFINKVILDRGFKNSKVIFAPVGKAGDNYAANVKRITIEGENGNSTMIAKLAPTNEFARGIMNAVMLFKNEHTMYFEFLPKFVQLQKDAGVPEKDQLKYAKCYGSFAEPPHEVILLEDLKALNFSMLDRFVSLTDECMQSVLKNVATLHSMSYALKEREPNVFEEFKSNLTDMWDALADSPQMRLMFESLENQVLTILDEPDHINLVKNKITIFLDTASKLAKVDGNNRHSVILQGDAWTNNIMFRIENDIQVESIMIDYQMSRHGSPVSDLMYLIFNCTDHETRRKHFHDWLDYYHTELDKSLSNFNLKANFEYPRDKLDADMKRYGKLLFGQSVLMAGVTTRKSEDAAKMMQGMDTMNAENIEERMQEMATTELDKESVNLFRNRVTGLIESFTEYGLL